VRALKVALLILRCSPDVDDLSLSSGLLWIEGGEGSSSGAFGEHIRGVRLAGCDPSNDVVKADAIELDSCEFGVLHILHDEH
jgi:hypothetical protein